MSAAGPVILQDFSVNADIPLARLVPRANSKLIKFVQECCTAAGSTELANSSARW